MLPVSTGFIFPDGKLLDTGSKGHNRCAYRYIMDNNLIDAFSAYERETGGEEGEFLIECLGAVKVCHYNGQHFLYVPRMQGDIIKAAIKKYKKAGYKIVYFNKQWIYNEPIMALSSLDNRYPYNQIVIEVKMPNGEKYMTYNPRRIGD